MSRPITTSTIRAGGVTAVLAVMALGAAIAVGASGGSNAAAPKLRSCTAGAGVSGCKALPAGSLAGSSGLSLSPDGRTLYATSYGDDGISWFRRAGSGGLQFGGCIANDGANGCGDPSSDVLGGAAGVAVSPGGGDVYVASGLGASLTRFARSSGGGLTFAACTANDGRRGCTDPSRDSLADATGVIVGPDGADIYVASFSASTVSHLRRAPDGSLDVADCVSDGGKFGCSAPGGNVLEGADAIAMAGHDIYVTSFASGSISRFHRGKSGRLAYRGCYADQGANGCAKIPVDSLIGASGIAVSKDGKSLYTAAQSGTVARFTRIPRSGKLRFASCVGRDGKGGCAEPRRDSLEGATSVAVSPSGRDIYVASQRSSSITRLSLTRKGKLAFAGCTASKGAHRCREAKPTSLRGAYALTLRGRDLYATATLTGALSTLRTQR